MGVSVVDTITGFNKSLQTVFYNGSKTAVLKPAEKIFSENFGEVKIREIAIVGGAGNYSKSKGYDGAGGSATVNWRTYTADNDRYFNLETDAVEELASFLAGTKPSIIAGFEQFANVALAPEVDAVAMARAYAASISAGNTLDTSTLKNGFFDGLIDIEQILFNKGVSREHTVFAFIRSDVYAQGEKELVNKMGLANNAVLAKYTLEVPTGVDTVEPLQINVEAIKFNNFVLIRMPEERMGTEVTLLDGRTEGQESGGFTAGATKMSAVFIPEGAMFVDTRYEVANMTMPAMAYQLSTQADIDAALKSLVGDLKIDNIGINQKANGFSIDARVIYDAKAIEINKDKILCFTEA